jgi:hypothetical protein
MDVTRALGRPSAALAAVLFLAGCGGITGACTYETRVVQASGVVTDLQNDPTSAIVNVSATRGSLSWKDVGWSITAPSYAGHVTRLTLIETTTPTTALLNLPANAHPAPGQYNSSLIQREGETTPELGGIFEIVAANRAAVEITTDLPARPLITVPFTVEFARDWYRPNCY